MRRGELMEVPYFIPDISRELAAKEDVMSILQVASAQDATRSDGDTYPLKLVVGEELLEQGLPRKRSQPSWPEFPYPSPPGTDFCPFSRGFPEMLQLGVLFPIEEDIILTSDQRLNIAEGRRQAESS